MHHNFARSLNLLKTIEWHVIQIASRIQIPLFIPHNLFKEVVPTCFPLLLLQEEVVGRSYLIVLVVLDISYGLSQITIRVDAGGRETVLDFAEVLVQNRNPIFTDYDTFQFCWLDLLVPLMHSDIFD